jgi:hypothetical protein
MPRHIWGCKSRGMVLNYAINLKERDCTQGNKESNVYSIIIKTSQYA